MKKTTVIAAAALLLLSATSQAQTDTTAKPQTTMPETTTTSTTRVNNDKYNNWTADTYKMQPMPDALTTDKIFPVIGKYELTTKEGTATPITVTLDEANKGLVWIDGLPEGRIKATLRKSPSTYKIPAQTLGEEKDAKKIPEGVLVYDKDANTMNVCLGCKYNVEDPGTAFLPATEEPATVAETKTKTKNGKVTKSKTKMAKVKPVHYTGVKQIQENAVAPAPTMN